MKPAILSLPLALVSLIAGGCGDDGGIDCGEGTVAVDGLCVPEDVGGGGPASRRLCNTDFGPVGDDAIFVSASYEGDDSDGSQERPFLGIQQAIDAATTGQEIGIATGMYAENLSITSPVSLEGRCARDVVIQGSVVVKDTGGTAVRGVTVTGGSPGVLADNAQPLATDEFGLELRYLVVTDNQGAGIEIDGSSVRVQDSEFTLARQITDGNINQLGSGIFVRNGSNIDIRTSIISMNGFMGVDMADATGMPLLATGDGSSKVTAPTLPSTGIISMNGIIGNSGGGIRINGAASGQAAGAEAPLVQILSNDFASNAGLAVFASSSRVDVLANTMAGASNSHSGVRFDHTAGAISGNQISDYPKGGIALETCVGVGITGNTLLNNTEIGILVQNSDGISIASNRVEGTKLGTAGLAYATGHGIYVGADDQNSTGRYDINSNTVVDNAGVGVAVDSLDIGDTKRVMFSMLNNEIAGNGYAGITVQDTRDGEIFGNTLTDNVGFGVRCIDGPGQDTRIFFDGNIVRGTTFAPTPNKNGHAVVMNDCHISVDENQIENNAQYGILLDNGITGGCDDNIFLGHQADIVLQNSPSMSPNGNQDTVDGPVVNLSPPEPVLYDQDLVTPPMITPGL